MWDLLAAPDGFDVYFPAVNAGNRDRTPTGDGSTFVGTRVEQVDLDYADDYDAYLLQRATSLTLPSTYVIRTTTTTP